MGAKWSHHQLRVHYKETDQMGVVHHSNYITWFEIARTEMMRESGITYHETEKRGLLSPVVDFSLKYISPALYDDLVVVFFRITRMTPIRLAFEYDVRRLVDSPEENRVDEPYGDQLATGSSTHVWVDHDWEITRLDKAAPDIHANLLAYT